MALHLTIAGGRALRALPLALAAECLYVGRSNAVAATFHPQPGQLHHSPSLPRFACRSASHHAGSLRCILLSLDYPYPLEMLTANDILADVDFDHSIDWPGTALEQTSRSMTSRLPQDGYTHVADAVALEITAASELLVARVGGFRIHLLRAGRVSLIGSDHNLLSDPSASAEAARRHLRADNPGSSLLARIVSRHLGTPHVPETAAIPVEAHDSLVVCSQTVHHWREPESYAVALRQHGSAALATDGIVAVIELGGHSL